MEGAICGSPPGCLTPTGPPPPTPAAGPGGGLQARRNADAYTKDSSLYQNAILRLAEQIRNCLQVHSQMETETARSGWLDQPPGVAGGGAGGQPGLSAAVQHQPPRLFGGRDPGRLFFRMHCQEVIAAQGYILSESLNRCGVPVRVSSFCSLRGYTILRVLKGFGDKGGSRKIFDYFASGWNRTAWPCGRQGS